jgi:hypothetical protein
MRPSFFGRLAHGFLAASLLLPALAAPASARAPMMARRGMGGPAHPHAGAPHLRHHGQWAAGLGGVAWAASPSVSSAETFSPNIKVYEVNYPDLVKSGGDCVIVKLAYDDQGRFVGARRVNAC